MKQLSFRIGLGIVVLLVVVAVAAPLLAPYGSHQGSIVSRLLPIGSHGHLLGTDGQGYDVLSRLMWGAGPSLLAGVAPVALSTVAGTLIGLFAGLSGPRVNALVMRALDVLFAFPAVLLAISITLALGPGLTHAIWALSIILVPPMARITEGEVARIRTADFVEVAKASGAGRAGIAFSQVLPNALPLVLAYASTQIGLCITYIAGLSFIGLGAVAPQAEWGLMLNETREDIFSQPLMVLFPAAAIFLAALGFNLCGAELVRRAQR